ELKRQNVNLEQGFLQIVGSKTKSSNRKVWLSERTSRILKSRIDRFEYLFPKGEKDSADATNQLNAQHQTAIKQAKLKFRLYDCRHTFATRILENGVDLLTLASMLGHSSLDEVMRYAHPSESSKKEAANQMQKRKAKAV
ncbi:MAG: tyrosine-type recombinase/integrase, partial [Pyrinomonadaceae bacterium]